MCVFGLICPKRKAHAPCYIVTFGQAVSTIFFHFILQTAKFSGKKLLNIQHVFLSYPKPLSETFFILRRNKRDIIINVLESSRNPCQILMKFEFSSKIFENPSNIKSRENSSIGSRDSPCGRTDQQANRQFCKCA
jgi:hypothetical protein